MTFSTLILFLLVSLMNLALGFAAAAWTGHGPPLSFYLPSRKQKDAAAAGHAPASAEAHPPAAHGGHH